VSTIHRGGTGSPSPRGVSGPSAGAPTDGLDAALAEQIGLGRWAVLARLAHLMSPDGAIPGAWSVQMPTPTLIAAVAAGDKGWVNRIPTALDELVTLGLLERVASTPLGRGRGRIPTTWYAAWDPRFATPSSYRATGARALSPTPPTGPGTPLTHPRFTGVQVTPVKTADVKSDAVKPLTPPRTAVVHPSVHEGLPDPAAYTTPNRSPLMHDMYEESIHETCPNPGHEKQINGGDGGAVDPAASRMVLDLLAAIDWSGPPPAGVPDGVLVAVIKDLQQRQRAGQIKKPGGWLRTTYGQGGPDAVIDYATNRCLLRSTLGQPASIAPEVELMPASEFAAARDADPSWYDQVRQAAAAAAPEGTVLTTAHLQAAALTVPLTAHEQGKVAR
jgi:hypothetical protein